MNAFWTFYFLIGLALGVLGVAYVLAFPERLELEFEGPEVHPLWVLIWIFTSCLFVWPVPLLLVLKDMNDSDGPWRG